MPASCVARALATASAAWMLAACSLSYAASPLMVHYDISVKIDPGSRRLEGRSVITANGARDYKLLLNERFEVKRILLDDEPLRGRRSSAGGLQFSRVNSPGRRLNRCVS